jgi:hypothetical protein
MPTSRPVDLRVKNNELVGKTLNLRLYTAVPTATTAGTEVTGGSYAPQSVTIALNAQNLAVTTNDVLFAGMPAATVTSCAVWNATEMLFYGTLTASLSTAAGDTVSFKAGSLTINVD